MFDEKSNFGGHYIFALEVNLHFYFMAFIRLCFYSFVFFLSQDEFIKTCMKMPLKMPYLRSKRNLRCHVD